MSRIQVDNIFNKEGTGAPTLPSGAVVTGVTTSTTFDGDLTGNVTGNVTGTAATFTTLEATTYIGVPAGGVDVLESMLFV